MSTDTIDAGVDTIFSGNSDSMLADMYSAVKLQFTWWGTRRALTDDQVKEASAPFHAQKGFMNASKKLANTKNKAFRKVTRCRSAAKAYWRHNTLPYPEPGIRLIKRTDILRFDSEMARQQANLAEAVEGLEEQYDDLLMDARLSLGTLFNPADYPSTLKGAFALNWDYISVQPPEYLKDASPEIYEAAVQRVEARFAQAVEMAEQAFIDEFGKLVHNLSDRMAPDEAGQPKIFRDTIITNLKEFFGRFRTMNVSDSDALEALVKQAEDLVSGVNPNDLRASPTLRADIKAKMDDLFGNLEGMMSDRPRRRLLGE